MQTLEPQGVIRPRYAAMATHCAILKYWKHTYKNIHISTATHPRTENVVSNKSADLALLSDGWICKLLLFWILMNVHDNIRNELKQSAEKSVGNTYKINSISLHNHPRVPNMISQ